MTDELFVVFIVIPLLLIGLAALIYLLMKQFGIVSLGVAKGVMKADMESEKIDVDVEEVITEKDGEIEVTKTIRKHSHYTVESDGVKRYMVPPPGDPKDEGKQRNENSGKDIELYDDDYKKD